MLVDPEKVIFRIDYLGPAKPGQVVKAIPGQGSCVPVTLLGSSDFSARLAATLGLPFALPRTLPPICWRKRRTCIEHISARARCSIGRGSWSAFK